MAFIEGNPIRRKREAVNELVAGGSVDCLVKSLTKSGWDGQQLAGRISAVHGGGFYGRVLELDGVPDIVIKTAQPDDPIHEFWRLANWRRPFPSQTLEAAARHDYLCSCIIHKLSPCVTEDAVWSPKPLGYTFINGVGYAQVLEKIKGRGPRFDVELNEPGLLREIQRALLEIGTDFGLEHLGQIHPDNPFAFTNLWLDNLGGVTWLDTQPAIRHTGLVAPFFYFAFHKDIQRRLGTTKITFNRIHTDLFRVALVSEKYRNLIPDAVRGELEEDLIAYEQNFQGVRANELFPQDFASSCIQCGLLTRTEAEALLKSGPRYLAFVTGMALEPLVLAISNMVLERTPVRFLRNKHFREQVIAGLKEMLSNKDLRNQLLLEKSSLIGVNAAYQKGYLSSEEAEEVRDGLGGSFLGPAEKRKMTATYAGLLVYYFTTGRIIDAIEYSSYLSALFVERPEMAVGIGLFVGWVLPSIIRPLGTVVAQNLSGVDLRVATRVSVIPKLGSWISVPANLAASAGDRRIWHYTLRNIVAGLSGFMKPWGGWGTQHEAELWDRLSPLFGENNYRPDLPL